MSASLVSELDWSSVIAGDYGLWVAAYTYNNTPINNFNMPESNDPNPSWGAVGNIMWQFTSTGQIPGVKSGSNFSVITCGLRFFIPS